MSTPTREVELKARVDDLDAARCNVERDGAVLVFDGTLHDRIYDSADRALTSRDVVLRLRSYSSKLGVSAHLDWKGATLNENGFKVRAELTTGVSDPDSLAGMLTRLGYQVIRAIDRRIVQYEIPDPEAGKGAMVRFEKYPRMDTLVEVEGTEAQIERAIGTLGIPRDQFSASRLRDFVGAFEQRTGQRAAVSDAELEE